MTQSHLLADFGATHARFAVLSGGEFVHIRVMPTGDYETPEEAITAYLADVPASDRPLDAALAVAGPVTGDRVRMMNNGWHFSIEAMKQRFGWSELQAVNDFTANALGIPHLTAEHLIQIGSGTPVLGAPVAVVGPGTGLGVGGLVPFRDHWIAIPGEGGNVGLAPADSREGAIIDILRRQYAHVTVESVLSGPGLVNLYESLCEMAGKPATPSTPEHITHLYPGCDPQCREAVAMFCGMLGTFAGDVALTMGARGGVYIMGGIVPKIVEIFRHSAFRERFEFKGRYRQYLSEIPTYVVTHPFPAFLGLRTLFAD